MRSRLFLPGLLLLCVFAHFLLAGKVWDERAETRRAAESGYVVPAMFSRVLALDYRGVVSDFLMLKVTTFYGERAMFQQALSEQDWSYIIRSLEVVTDLDPYFLDPYLLVESLLAWEAGRVEEANRLLDKGREYRKEDWLLPFFIGFNCFYFQRDFEKGAEYLMVASRLPGSPDFLPTLAARLGYYADKSKTAIMFLKGLLAQTDDKRVRAQLEKRLAALERAALLEECAEKFEHDQGRLPHSVDELVRKGYLERLPEDPYGGKWIILEKGRIYSTSKFTSQSDSKAKGSK